MAFDTLLFNVDDHIDHHIEPARRGKRDEPADGKRAERCGDSV